MDFEKILHGFWKDVGKINFGLIDLGTVLVRFREHFWRLLDGFGDDF